MSPALYGVGTDLLVEQYERWWPARVVEVRGEADVSEEERRSASYWKIHYQGWNVRWDMWVGWKETRLWSRAAQEEADRANAALDERKRARKAKQRRAMREEDDAGRYPCSPTQPTPHSSLPPLASPPIRLSRALLLPQPSLSSCSHCPVPPPDVLSALFQPQSAPLPPSLSLRRQPPSSLSSAPSFLLSSLLTALLRRRCVLCGAAARARRSSASAVDAIGEPLLPSDSIPLPASLSPLVKASQLPGSLRRRLLSDWQWVTRKRHILRLPREPSVAELLRLFLASLPSSSQRDATTEVCAGLLIYFERCVARILLYRIERPQLLTWRPRGSGAEAPLVKAKDEAGEAKRGAKERPRANERPQPTGDEKPSAESLELTPLAHARALQLLSTHTPASCPPTVFPSFAASAPSSSSASSSPLCCVYGGEHLLRLLVKLPFLLSDSELTPLQASALTSTVAALVHWLQAHEAEAFNSAAYTFVDKAYLQLLDAKDCRDPALSVEEEKAGHERSSRLSSEAATREEEKDGAQECVVAS